MVFSQTKLSYHYDALNGSGVAYLTVVIFVLGSVMLLMTGAV